MNVSSMSSQEIPANTVRQDGSATNKVNYSYRFISHTMEFPVLNQVGLTLRPLCKSKSAPCLMGSLRERKKDSYEINGRAFSDENRMLKKLTPYIGEKKLGILVTDSRCNLRVQDKSILKKKGHEIETNYRVIAENDYKKGSILAHTIGYAFGIPLISLTVDGAFFGARDEGIKAVLEIVTAPLSDDEEIKYKAFKSAYELSKLLKESGVYFITLESLISKYNSVIESICDKAIYSFMKMCISKGGTTKGDWYIEIKERSVIPAKELEQYFKKNEARIAFTTLSINSLLRRGISKEEETEVLEPRFKHQVSYHIPYKSISSFSDCLFQDAYIIGNPKKALNTVSGEKTWLECSTLAADILDLKTPEDKKNTNYLLCCITHWLVRIFMVTHTLYCKGRIHGTELRNITPSIRVSLYQEVFEILNDDEVKYFCDLVDKKNITEVGLIEKIKISVQYEVDSLFRDWIVEEIHDLISCFKIRRINGRKQVQFSAASRPFIGQDSKSFVLLPNSGSKCLTKMTGLPEFSIRRFVLPVQTFNNEPWCVVEFRGLKGVMNKTQRDLYLKSFEQSVWD